MSRSEVDAIVASECEKHSVFFADGTPNNNYVQYDWRDCNKMMLAIGNCDTDQEVLETVFGMHDISNNPMLLKMYLQYTTQ